MREEKGIAVLLAGGSGTRMHAGGVPQTAKKQFLDLDGKPLMAHALAALEQSNLIDAIVIAVSAGDEDYVQREIVERFAFQKVRAVVAGGKERYHSVYAGLCAAERLFTGCKEHTLSDTAGTGSSREDCIVYIQDAARPFLTEDILQRVRDGVVRYGACVAAVPVKDTIKQADGDGLVTGTPDRKTLWAMQTPQAFLLPVVFDAYTRLIRDEERGADCSGVTDDAMVVERYFPHRRVYLAEGSYRNTKVTTPEDFVYARALLS